MRPEIVEPPGLGQVGTGVEPKFVQDARFPEEVDNVVLARAEPATRAEPKFVKDARVPEGVDNELPAEAEPTEPERERIREEPELVEDRGASEGANDVLETVREHELAIAQAEAALLTVQPEPRPSASVEVAKLEELRADKVPDTRDEQLELESEGEGITQALAASEPAWERLTAAQRLGELE